MGPTLLADYAVHQDGCAERSRSLQLGQKVAPGCESYVSSGSSSSGDGKLPQVAFDASVGAIAFSGYEPVPPRLGPTLGVGASFHFDAFDIGLMVTAFQLGRPHDSRTFGMTVGPRFLLRVPLAAQTELRVGPGFAVGPRWIGGVAAASYAQGDFFAHLVSADERSRFGVGPLVRLSRFWAIRSRETAWSATLEIGMIF